MAARALLISSGKTTTVKLSKLKPSALRLRFQSENDPALEESIAKHGLFHPVIARFNGEEYEVVSGHRRLEALRNIGADDVPCKVIEATDKEAFEISLVENLQRKSINPVEEALAFHQYLDVLKWGNRRSLASRIGKSPEYVTHRLRLLQLPKDVLARVGKELSTSHAEELAWVGDVDTSRRLAKYAEGGGVSVQELHELVKVEKGRRRRSKKGEEAPVDSDFAAALTTVSDDERARGVLKTGAAALRYVMYFLGDSADSMNSSDLSAVRSFLTEERYKVHQIVDDFISAQVKVDRALRNGKAVSDLKPQQEPAVNAKAA